MTAFFNWLARAMGDGENPSTTRLIVVATVPAVVLVPLCVWAVLSLRAHALLELPGTVTGFAAACLTTLLGALHLNKKEETKNP